MKKRAKDRKAATMPRKSRQDGSGTRGGHGRGPQHPREMASSEQLRALLAQAEKRLLRIFRDETGTDWQPCSSYRWGAFATHPALLHSRVLTKAPPRTAMYAHNGLGWLGGLRRLLDGASERESRMALVAFRVARSWMEAELLEWAKRGARVWHRKPDPELLRLYAACGSATAGRELEKQNEELEKMKDRLLAFQEAKLRNPQYRDSENAADASEKLYGTRRSWKTVLETCRKFDQNQPQGRSLLGPWKTTS